MFRFWLDPEMTSQVPNPYLITHKGIGCVDMVLYYGSNDPQESVTSLTDEPITLMPVGTLMKWEPARFYKVGYLIEPTTPNGLMYKCTMTGTTSDVEPDWDIGHGGKAINSGLAQFTVNGEKFIPNDVRMSLSKSGLDSAEDGGGIILGESLQGGVSVAIHIRVTNHHENIRVDDFAIPCIFIATNKVRYTKSESGRVIKTIDTVDGASSWIQGISQSVEASEESYAPIYEDPLVNENPDAKEAQGNNGTVSQSEFEVTDEWLVKENAWESIRKFFRETFNQSSVPASKLLIKLQELAPISNEYIEYAYWFMLRLPTNPKTLVYKNIPNDCPVYIFYNGNVRVEKGFVCTGIIFIKGALKVNGNLEVICNAGISATEINVDSYYIANSVKSHSSVINCSSVYISDSAQIWSRTINADVLNIHGDAVVFSLNVINVYTLNHRGFRPILGKVNILTPHSSS